MELRRIVLFLFGILIELADAWSPPSLLIPFSCARHYTSHDSTTALLGLMDSVSDFFRERVGDFVKLEDSENVFGPGPLIIMYGVPDGVLDEEIQDMISDCAPVAFQKGAKLKRLDSGDQLLTETLETALNEVSNGSTVNSSQRKSPAKIPVLLFSGFINNEMMNLYNVIGSEIYQETGGLSTPACAKAVENAMAKPLQQVIDEISGDHADAMGVSAS